MSDDPAPPAPPPFTSVPYDGPGDVPEGEGVIHFDQPPPADPEPLEIGEPAPPTDYSPAQMATYAIGKPGEHPRFLLTAPTGEDAEAQRQPGEVLFAVVAAPPEPYRIAPSGDHLESVNVDLEVLRRHMWQAAKAYRDERQAGPFQSSFGPVQTDDRSQRFIASAVVACKIKLDMGESLSIKFTLMDNSVVVLSTVEMIQLGFEAMAYVTACQDAGTAVRALIMAATDAVDLASVDIVAGYP